MSPPETKEREVKEREVIDAEAEKPLTQVRIDQLCDLVSKLETTPRQVQAFLKGLPKEEKYLAVNDEHLTKLVANVRHSKFGTRPTDYAAQSGNPEVLKYLIENLSMSLDYEDEEQNILYFAMQNFMPDALHYLLSLPDLLLLLNDDTQQIELDILAGKEDAVKKALTEDPKKFSAVPKGRTTTLLFWTKKSPTLHQWLVEFGKQLAVDYTKQCAFFDLANLFLMFAIDHYRKHDFREFFIFSDKAYEFYISSWLVKPEKDMAKQILRFIHLQHDASERLPQAQQDLALCDHILKRLIDSIYFVETALKTYPDPSQETAKTELLSMLHNKFIDYEELFSESDKNSPSELLKHQALRAFLEKAQPLYRDFDRDVTALNDIAKFSQDYFESLRKNTIIDLTHLEEQIPHLTPPEKSEMIFGKRKLPSEETNSKKSKCADTASKENAEEEAQSDVATMSDSDEEMILPSKNNTKKSTPLDLDNDTEMQSTPPAVAKEPTTAKEPAADKPPAPEDPSAPEEKEEERFIKIETTEISEEDTDDILDDGFIKSLIDHNISPNLINHYLKKLNQVNRSIQHQNLPVPREWSDLSKPDIWNRPKATFFNKELEFMHNYLEDKLKPRKKQEEEVDETQEENQLRR